MVAEIWVNIGSGNGLLPDGTKPLPEPVLIIISKIILYASESHFTRDTSVSNN